jgi:hypothetical protein
MRAFRECIEECDLIDVGWSGLPYTWDNRQTDSSNVKARIDRAFGNEALHAMFAVDRVRHVPMVESDHCLLAMQLRKKNEQQSLPSARSFRYENAWQTIGDYDKKIADLWKENCEQGGLSGLSKTLQNMQTELASWGNSELGNFKKKLALLRKDLERARRCSVGRGPSKEEMEIMGRLGRVLHQEEIWVKQRARVQWLRAGDRNTAYFHAQVAQRKRMNRISRLERGDGVLCESEEEVRSEIQGFYQNLYQSQGVPNMTACLHFVEERVTQPMR